jgi:Tol biopolymer transport system component
VTVPRAKALGALLALAAFALACGTSKAAFPGINGKIAYAVEGESPASVWTANVDGSEAVRLGEGRNPSFSPDGARIAFERWNGTGGDVLEMNADGSSRVPLATGSFATSSETEWEAEYETPEEPPKTIPFVKVQTNTSAVRSFSDPAFSPDGAQVAVSEAFEEHIFTAVCAASEAGGKDCIPAGDPGAYFSTRLTCAKCSGRIVVIDAATGARIGDATAPPDGYFDFEPAFSAGGILAFRREVSTGSSIFVADSPGAAPRQVTFGSYDWSPDFSPDGTKIAFTRESNLGLIDVGSGAVTMVPVPPPSGGEGFASYPVFAPDGARIAFDRGVFPQGTPGEGLYTIGLDGAGLSPVTTAGTSPSWQPLAPVPPPAPPLAAAAKRRKGRLKLDRNGRTTLGTVVCGSSACALSVLSARLRTGKRRCSVGAKLAKRRLEPAGSAQVGVRVSGGCLKALEAHGRGRLAVRVRVTDDLGQMKLVFAATVAPARAASKRGRR